MQTAALRQQIESSLSQRIPAALSPRLRPTLDRIPTGIPSLDALLDGGLPLGVISELTGPESSGRTSMAMAAVSALTRGGGVCAWIDVADALDPESAAANGIDLERLLWVRCGPRQAACRAGHSTRLPARRSRCLAAPGQPRHTGGGSPHPRSEGAGMPEAIGAMLQAHGGLYDSQMRREKKLIGTPGMPNRPLQSREEQVNSDRLPPRRGENLVLASAHGPRLTQPGRLVAPPAASSGKPWQALDQALRAADLLLQAGGFGAIVLDLGSTAPEAAWRIPMATWFRFRAACERTRISLLVLTQHPCARSSAELVVRLAPGTIAPGGTVLTGIQFQAEIERNRSHEPQPRIIPIRKPPQSERSGAWRNKAAWAT